MNEGKNPFLIEDRILHLQTWLVRGKGRDERVYNFMKINRYTKPFKKDLF